MAAYSDFWEWAYDQLQSRGTIDEVAQAAYDEAIGMCGNEGQVSIIEMTGMDAFYEATESGAEGTSQAYQILMSACPYPEAVTVILADTAGLIYELLNAELKDAQNELDESFQSDEEVGEGEDDFFDA